MVADSIRRTARGGMKDTDERLRLLERRQARGTPLPARLSTDGAVVDDWNDALDPGFYRATAATLNGPPAGSTAQYNGGWTARDSNGRTVQYVTDMRVTGDAWKSLWRRVFTGTTWTDWSSGAVQWGDILGKPASFPPSAHTHAAADVTSGVFTTARIPDLDAAKIVSGILATARIPNLDASKVNSGVLDLARIPDIPWADITGPLVTNMGTIDASVTPDSLPPGVSYAQAGTGWPNGIGTVMTVNHSTYRAFQLYFDRNTGTRVWVRAANGPTAWQAFQEFSTTATPSAPFATASGYNSTSSSGTVNVTFPTGRFTVAPNITIGSYIVGGNIAVSASSATGATFAARNNAGAAIAAAFAWTATQMTATSANG